MLMPIYTHNSEVKLSSTTQSQDGCRHARVETNLIKGKNCTLRHETHLDEAAVIPLYQQVDIFAARQR